MLSIRGPKTEEEKRAFDDALRRRDQLVHLYHSAVEQHPDHADNPNLKQELQEVLDGIATIKAILPPRYREEPDGVCHSRHHGDA